MPIRTRKWSGNRNHADALEIRNRPRSGRLRAGFQVFGFALNVDGTAAEIGRGQNRRRSLASRATFDPANTQYSWKLFTPTAGEGATPGEHTLVSRATDINRPSATPPAADLTRKKTFLQDNAPIPA